MASFVFWLLLGGIFSTFPAVFCSNCCDDRSSCGTQMKVNSASKTSPCGKEKNLFNGYCVSKCPTGRYAASGKCSKCHETCSSCQKGGCLGCKMSSNFLANGLCEPKCHSPKLMKNSSRPRTRLVEGRTSLEGVVEVYYDGSWGTVCADNSWDMNAAKVLCKELKLGDVVEVKIVGQDRFTRSDGYKDTNIWLSGVKCTGKEDSITQCNHEDWGENECSHLEDVGVRCSGPDSTKTCETLCGDGYYASDGKCLPCPLDCKTCTAPDNCSSCVEKRFLEGNSCVANCKPDTFGDSKTGKCLPCPDVCKTCRGTDDGVKCTSCSSGKYLVVDKCVSQCGAPAVAYSKFVRLSGNYSSPYMGLLEVKFNGGWHTVCDDGFNLNTARVFCRELGYGQPIRYRGGEYGQGETSILTSNILCNGAEESFVECRQEDWFSSLGCSHVEDVGLSCQPPQGYHVEQECIEKCPPGMFSSKDRVCGLCNRKCLTCSGNSENCQTCRHPYLFNGTTCVGTCPDGTYANRTVGQCLPCKTGCMTCSDRADKCLSCVPPYLHNDTSCERACPDKMFRKGYSCVSDCGLRHYAKNKACHSCTPKCLACNSSSVCQACKHGFALTKNGICETMCTGDQLWVSRDPKSLGINLPLRLSNVKGSKFKGRLEIKHDGVWGSICDDGWKSTNADVACRDLFLGPPVRYLYVRPESFKEMNISKIWLDDVDCTGKEDSLADCKHPGWARENCGHSEDVHIECQGPGVSTCEDQCPAAHYQNGTNCEPCSVHCSACTGGMASNCSSCKTGYFRMTDGRCISDKCPPGFYAHTVRRIQHCKPCHPTCWTCTGLEPFQCASCRRPNLLQGKKCVRHCDQGTFGQVENHFIRLGMKRGPYEGVVMVTMKGRTGFVCDRYLKIEDGHVVCRELQMGKALQVYERSMYSHYTTPILLINPKCLGSESSILHCPKQNTRYSYCSRRSIMSVQCSGPDLSSRCVAECSVEKGFYKTGDGLCDYCSKKCLRCETNASKCTACAKDFLLTWDNKCVSYCREGTYLKADGTCAKCNLQKCVACYGNDATCTVCANDTYQSGRKCVEKCEPGLYKILGSTTVRLSEGLNSSRGLVEIFTEEGKWVSVCATNWNVRAAVVVCRELGYGDPVQIYSRSSYAAGYLSGEMLKPNCTGEELKLTQCAKLGTCFGNQMAGVKCSRSAPKRGCVNSACGVGYYLTPDECRPCSAECATCTGNVLGSRCSSCEKNRVLDGSSCVENCPDGHFAHRGVNKCLRCSDRCKTCFDGLTDDRCSSCNKPYFLRDTSCVDDCYPDYSLTDLQKASEPENPSPSVRLVNGSNAQEGFIQVFRNNLWGILCRKTTFVINLVCRELGYESGSFVGYRNFDDPIAFTQLSPSCKYYEKSLKDCEFGTRTYCVRPPFIACSKKRRDMRVCRKEKKVPCSPRTCYSQTSCVDGDDKLIRKGHSYCGHCPPDYYGDGENCTVIGRTPPIVLQNALYNEQIIYLNLYTSLRCYGRIENKFIPANRYSWYKDGKLLQLPASQSQVTRLRLRAAGYGVAGIYTCVLRSSAGSTVITFNVSVIGRPLITRADNVDVVHGNPVMLTCEVMAHRPAVITWRFNNETIGVNSTRSNGSRVLGNGSLAIPHPIEQDGGNYSCIATNEYGRSSEVVLLRITEELTFEKKAGIYEVSLGRKASFTCRPLATGREMKIRWRRHGQTLKTGDKYDVNGETLIVKKVSDEDCGEYYCVARDGLSIITSIGTLAVTNAARPCIHTPPQDLLLEDGMYARFYCAASGKPSPKILWQNNDQPEPKPNVLEIKKVNISHVGVYTCTARSGHTAYAYAFLSVDGHHACPFILEYPHDSVANFGNDAHFRCDGMAVRPYTISWYRGSSLIKNNAKYGLQDGNRKLVIHNVNQGDIGEYKCTVRGKYGEINATASLTSTNVGAQKSNSSPNTAGIVIGVLICIIVILIILFFVYRYRRHGNTPVDVMKNMKRKTITRFQSPTISHTVLKYNSKDDYVDDDEDDEGAYDTSDTNPFVRE